MVLKCWLERQAGMPMAPAFTRYIGIDYSGAQTPVASLKGLLQPPQAPPERTVAGVEGWILGVG